MNPTFPAGGSFWPIHAVAHSSAFSSMHIGSGPGVVGLSGMHVKLLVPFRSVLTLPWAVAAMMLAALATLGGAAVSALSISLSSLIAAAVWCSCACEGSP